MSKYSINSYKSDVASDPRLAVLLCMCSGCIILFLGAFNLGGIVNFISHPVLVGFISAASIVIPFSLLERFISLYDHKYLNVILRVFGIGGLDPSFPTKMVQLAQAVFAGQAKYLDAILGFSTLAVLLLLKHGKIRKDFII